MAEGLTLNDETLLFFFNNREKDSISARDLIKGTGRVTDASRISFLKAAGMLLTVNPHESPWRYRITKQGETRVLALKLFPNSTKRLPLGTLEPTILKYLRDNSDLEFQAHKIIEATGMSRTSVSTTLSRLSRAGKINVNKDHGKPWYYSIAGSRLGVTSEEAVKALPNTTILKPGQSTEEVFKLPESAVDNSHPSTSQILELKKTIQKLKVNAEETVFLARNTLEQAMDAITVSEMRYKSASKRIAELTEEAESFSVLKRLIAKMS